MQRKGKLSTNQSSKRLWQNIHELGFNKDQVNQSDLFSADEFNTNFVSSQNHNFKFHNNLQFCIPDPSNSFYFHNVFINEQSGFRSRHSFYDLHAAFDQGKIFCLLIIII